MQRFSMGEAIKFGWEITKNNMVFFVGLLIFVLIISSLISLIPESVTKNLPTLSIFFGIVSFVINILVNMGLIRIALKFCDKDRGEFSDLISTLPQFFKFLFGWILYVLIVIGGFILLIFPGIIWGIKFQYFGYLIIDEDLDPIEALKKSSKITDGVKWDLLHFNIFLGIFNVIGFFFFIIGLFLSIPTTMIAFAYVYRKLLPITPVSQREEFPKIGW